MGGLPTFVKLMANGKDAPKSAIKGERYRQGSRRSTVYRLPPSAARVTLRRDLLAVPRRIGPGAEAVVAFRKG